MTRTLCSGTPVTTEVRNRAICGFCDVLQRVNSPIGALHWASAERGSIGFAMSRGSVITSLTVTAASWNAASASPPATAHVNAMLFGTSSCSCGAPSCAAAFGLTTTSSGS